MTNDDISNALSPLGLAVKRIESQFIGSRFIGNHQEINITCVPCKPGTNNTYTPKRIIKNNNAMIVFWNDGTKTIVKRASDELDSDYAAFSAAVCIKLYGSNSALKRIVARTETQKPKKQKDDTRYRIACPVCGATFIKTSSEVRTKDGTVSTTCLDCGNFITVRCFVGGDF